MAWAGPWATVCTAYGHVPSRGAQGLGTKGERSGSCAQPVSPWRADRPWPYGNDAPIGRPEGGGRARVAGRTTSSGSPRVSAMFALGGAIVVLRRDAAWAALAAAGLVAVLSLFGAILAWRAARRARKAVALLEELRRTVRRPQPSIVPGPLGGQVP